MYDVTALLKAHHPHKVTMGYLIKGFIWKKELQQKLEN